MRQMERRTFLTTTTMAAAGVAITGPLQAAAQAAAQASVQNLLQVDPTPLFELAYYSDIEPPHWREPQGFWATKVWAAGQVVCLRDAMNQLAERAADPATDPKLLKDAYSQAMGHLLLLKHLAGGAAATQLEAVSKDLQAADAANDKVKLAVVPLMVMTIGFELCVIRIVEGISG